MNLSQNFTLEEMTRNGRGVTNTPNDASIEALKLLCSKVLEPLRDLYGKPIKVNSGFRSLALNNRIKGSKTSQHMKGEALDLPLTKKEFLWIKDNLEFDQLIYEFGNDSKPEWVHVSYSTKNRKQVLRATKKNGKTVYSNY